MSATADTGGTCRCPTCRAVQEWSDVCRRCRCDLSLLRATELERQARREACLRQLHVGQPHEALAQARAAARIQGDEAALRLLAVCELACGHFAEAAALARRLIA